ncbi:uncharacterized protein LOC117113267, partial [Anneissia japonica]|uniref:uncharacterized protein LOC117113267 n=1 Tax=Anneissia japonica TaxID=1529436 RepID=UPI001425A8B1
RTHSLTRPSRGMPYRKMPIVSNTSLQVVHKVPTKDSEMQTEIIGDVKPIMRTLETDSQTFVPELVESEVWTHEPEFDWFLNVKVYRPIGFHQQNQLRCSINYQKQFQKTELYRSPPDTPTREKRVKIVEPDKLGRTKSMIGSKARSSMGRKKKDVAEDEAWKDE